MLNIWIALLVGVGLACAEESAQGPTTGIYKLTWYPDSHCVVEECRLQDSPTLRALTSSCALERCGVSELVPTTFEALTEHPLALLFTHYDEDKVHSLVRNLNRVLDIYVLKHGEAPKEPGGTMWVMEYGKRVTEEPVNVLEALMKGTMGGILNQVSGPAPDLAARRSSMRVCAREFRRNAARLGEEGKEETLALLDSCLGKTLLDDTQSEESFVQTRLELWEKARDLGVISKAMSSMDPEKYAEEVWREVFSDHNKDAWLSVSWVPVFESFHGGLGHGDRSEALLLELVEVEPVDPETPTASAIISTKSGHSMRVKGRKVLALVACEDDDLESVLSSVRRATPNVFRVQRLVWGMGFVGDHSHYQEIEQDWNGDEAYASHGQMLPRYEDNARRMAKAKQEEAQAKTVEA